MNKRVLITGSASGIGLELVRHYIEQGAEVLAVARKSNDELESTSAEIISGIDVSKDSSMAALSKAVGKRSLDIVINCAGVLLKESLDDLNFQAIQEQFDVNALGPLRVTKALLENISSGSKIAMITSRMGSIADNGSGSFYGYRMSKAALNAASKSLGC